MSASRSASHSATRIAIAALLSLALIAVPGTAFADDFDGTDSGETIVGTPGDDTIDAKGGDDSVFGDSLDDSSSGGDDVIEGGSGDDLLVGDANRTASGGGDDDISGGEGDDLLAGDGYTSATGGDDVLDGGPGDDLILGDGRISYEGGNDTLIGGDGDDELHGDADASSQDGGDDRLFGGAGNDTLYGDTGGVDVGGGEDVLFGGAGDDTLYGNSGNDLLCGEDGHSPVNPADYLEGGLGTDIACAIDDRVTVDAGKKSTFNLAANDDSLDDEDSETQPLRYGLVKVPKFISAMLDALTGVLTVSASQSGTIRYEVCRSIVADVPPDRVEAAVADASADAIDEICSGANVYVTVNAIEKAAATPTVSSQTVTATAVNGVLPNTGASGDPRIAIPAGLALMLLGALLLLVQRRQAV